MLTKMEDAVKEERRTFETMLTNSFGTKRTPAPPSIISRKPTTATTAVKKKKCTNY